MASSVHLAVHSGYYSDKLKAVERTLYSGDFLKGSFGFGAKPLCSAHSRRFAKKPFVDFYGDCYKTTSWVEAYSRNIIPVGHPSEWNIPEDVRSRVVYPPPFRAQAGRPKKKRFKSVGEYRNGKTRNCTICGKSGHNRQNCRNAQPCQIPVPSVTSATAATFATSKRPRRPYRCRKCGEEGHNSQKCPLTPEVSGTT
ncbi:hypothetical protein LWI29_021659 [Acer saccharum]|uniref:CCHC-type domain-containing protein n=1 Tax=Acer saccharum TaxID=4024 RepID=A0AA39STJ4_ACESA|nr:hypothetical protein LWI29_021659 [Acer saccharum]